MSRAALRNLARRVLGPGARVRKTGAGYAIRAGGQYLYPAPAAKLAAVLREIEAARRYRNGHLFTLPETGGS